MLIANYSPAESLATWTLRRVTRAEVSGLEARNQSGVVIQSPNSEDWITRAQLPVATGGVGVRSLITPGRVVLLDAVQRVGVSLAPPGYRLVTAHNSRTGYLAFHSDSAVLEPDFDPGDTLTLTFEHSEGPADSSRDYFFLLGPDPNGSALQAKRKTASTRVYTFSLGQNRPNPFERTTQLSFVLPHATRVRLEIFDTQGRRVRVLANGAFEAGEHELTWDGRDSSGALARGGIYWYRIEAGEHRAQKRLVMLP